MPVTVVTAAVRTGGNAGAPPAPAHSRPRPAVHGDPVPVGGSPSGTRRPGGRPPCPLTGLVTGERNHEERADRGFAVAAITAKYLNSQRLRLVCSEDGSRARPGRLQTRTRA